MQTIEFTCGTSIDRAAADLVSIAPAQADFNGVRVRARYATTRPFDIVAHYMREMEIRSIVYRHSPAGKKNAAEQETTRQRAQAMVSALVAGLPDLDFANPAHVVQWVDQIADPADRVGVSFNKPAIVALFASHGWDSNVNTGDAFDAADPRNFAGWIVGQWLHCGYPGVTRFCEQWRQRFEEP